MLGCNTQPQTSTKVSIGKETFQLELALDMQSRTAGLMHRTEIPSDGGMLFVFPDAIARSFWMKNCLLPIDLLFLDSRGTITALHEMPIEPDKSPEENDLEYERRLKHYWSGAPARFAIELKSGSIQRLQLKINDHIDLDTAYLRSIAR
jgi:uncharacterized protein